MATLLWLQGGGCSGNTMSFLNAEEPSACDLVTDFGIEWRLRRVVGSGLPMLRRRTFATATNPSRPDRCPLPFASLDAAGSWSMGSASLGSVK